MTLDECLEKDGIYILLECKKRIEEFELVVKDKKHVIYQISWDPFVKKIVNENEEFSLACDLHEDKGWENEH